MAGSTSAASFRFGRFELEPGERRLLASGVPLHLGPHAFDVLVALVERAGHLVTKDELLTSVWGDLVVEENTLQAHVSSLRKVLGAAAIATVSGRGYRFAETVLRIDPIAEARARRPTNNLPHPLTSFIGREHVLDELEQLLTRTRLLTLTGAGGCGKTRLAIEFARERARDFSDGAWLVELASLGEPALLAQTVATALGLREKSRTRPLDIIAEFLSPRTALLILDNAEHLVQDCAELAVALLQRCGRLTVLVTSREPLSVTGELLYRVPSLSVPENASDATPESVSSYEAARLFIERARLQHPQFAVTPQNAPALASVCMQLDGIALALELAAPRVRMQSVEELCGALERRFDVLTQGSRTALPRHRTLRALIDWSYDLLSEVEQAALRRASIFAGGWTLEAAERVCRPVDRETANVLSVMTSLADKNLVVAESRDGETRYGMLETVRYYAQERMREDAGLEKLQRDHTAFFLALAEQANRQKSGSDARRWLQRLDVERSNIRAALAHSIAADDSDAGLRLAAAVCWYWIVRGQVAEGMHWVSAALAAAPLASPSLRLDVLKGACMLAQRLGDHAAAHSFAERMLSIATETDDRRSLALAWKSLGMVAHSRRDYATARGWYERALATLREMDDKVWLSVVLSNLGQVATAEGKYAEAEAHLAESVALARAVDDYRVPITLKALGYVALCRGDLDRADALFDETLALARAMRDGAMIGEILHGKTGVAQRRGQPVLGLTFLREALAIHRDIGEPASLGTTLRLFGEIAADLGDPAAACRLWGWHRRFLEQLGSLRVLTPFSQGLEAAAASSLGTALSERLRMEGASLALDEVVDLALSLKAPAETSGNLQTISKDRPPLNP